MLSNLVQLIRQLKISYNFSKVIQNPLQKMLLVKLIEPLTLIELISDTKFVTLCNH